MVGSMKWAYKTIMYSTKKKRLYKILTSNYFYGSYTLFN